MDALHHEDIVLDIRDRIANELTRIQRRRVKLRPALINEVAGEMQFCVRHVHKAGDSRAPDADGWVWKDAADFDRMERFTTDSCSLAEDTNEVGQEQIVFKLSKLLGQREDQVMDDQPSTILEGYDCFGLYHHLDGSTEWRPAKIVKKEALHPNDSTMDQHQRLAKHDSTRFKYLVEFEHLKDYGQALWATRGREAVLFSARYARDEADFDSACHAFVLDMYSKSGASEF